MTKLFSQHLYLEQQCNTYCISVYNFKQICLEKKNEINTLVCPFFLWMVWCASGLQVQISGRGFSYKLLNWSETAKSQNKCNRMSPNIPYPKNQNQKTTQQLIIQGHYFTSDSVTEGEVFKTTVTYIERERHRDIWGLVPWILPKYSWNVTKEVLSKESPHSYYVTEKGC